MIQPNYEQEVIDLLSKSIHDIHNAATILQFHQRLEMAQKILDAAGEINLAINELREGQK